MYLDLERRIVIVRRSRPAPANPPLAARRDQGGIGHQELRVFREELGQVLAGAGILRAAAIRLQETVGGLQESPLPRQREAQILVRVMPGGIDRDGRPGMRFGFRMPAQEVQTVAPIVVEEVGHLGRCRRDLQPAGIHRLGLGIPVLLLQELARGRGHAAACFAGSRSPARERSTQAVASGYRPTML